MSLGGELASARLACVVVVALVGRGRRRRLGELLEGRADGGGDDAGGVHWAFGGACAGRGWGLCCCLWWRWLWFRLGLVERWVVRQSVCAL